MIHREICLLVTVSIVLATPGRALAQQPARAPGIRSVFARGNLVAWCIVPFDAKNRAPGERAEMLKRLGLKKVAYDWRANHVPTFEEEILQYKQQGLEYFAFWSTHEDAFKLFEKHGLHPQVWQTAPSPAAETREARVKAAAQQMLPLVERTRKLGSKLGLYNHGGWGGDPENLIAVCRYLREQHNAPHVGIVYNLHHGHGHLDDFAASLAAMKPYLLCLNLNGMVADGEQTGRKILPLGAGDLDLKLLTQIRDSGYNGPIGIIGHTQDDVEERLKDNLDGLDWLLQQLDGKPAGPKPAYRTYKVPAHAHVSPEPQQPLGVVPPHSPELIAKLIESARRDGDPHRGLMVFSSAKSACLSCHKLGQHGGAVGPELTTITKQRKPEEIVEGVLWPKRNVKPEFVAHAIIDTSGRSHQGYIVRQDERQVVLRDPTKPEAGEKTFALAEIDERREVGTLMPDNLTAMMSQQQLGDLLRLLLDLGTDNATLRSEEMNAMLTHAQAHLRGPATFAYDRQPLHPDDWPNWQHYVNRDRVYDYYAKEADYFRQQSPLPPLLPEFPGMDGGTLGHWGNQNENTWADGRWNQTILGSVQSGIFHAGKLTAPRGVCVQLDENIAACFDPETLTYIGSWSGGLTQFSSVRHGFMHGLQPPEKFKQFVDGKPEPPFEYHGFYRHGKTVVFAYRAGDVERIKSAVSVFGELAPFDAPAEAYPQPDLVKESKPQWPQEFETPIELGTGSPYAIDTIGLPFKNPWNALLFCGGHAFLPDGSAVVCTIQGDVWRVSGFEYPSKKARWRRFAAGLSLALGIVADKDGIFVLGRDQITRLHDLNNDGEADFYECFSKAYETSPAGHDFICGLERDAAGNFYIASGNQGLVRISADGKPADVIATGFRNPNGLGLYPDGTVTVPCSEGEWTPASMICAVRPQTSGATPHFGYMGPKEGLAPSLPLAYLPRGLDNSSGGQAYVNSDRWGPLAGQLVHFSCGAGTHFLVLRDEVEGQLQGAAVPLVGEFRSGVHRGRFNPHDGQLYVSGLFGWGCYTPDDGCFHRVRYTGDPVQLPIGFHVHSNGVAITFSAPLETETAANAHNHFSQCWNYRYSSGYGSPELSSQHPGVRAHDSLQIASAHVLADGRTLFLEIPDLQPVNQLHLLVQPAADVSRELFVTVHKLDAPFTQFPGYRPLKKHLQPHPILADLAMATRSLPNPFQKKIQNARAITIETGTNLSFATREVRVRPKEPIALTLKNPDVVPHNWALLRPGTLDRVGDLANRLISDPDASLRHYIPGTPDVLTYTNVVLPRDDETIYFRAPEKPGRYPYLCTFPGHWKVMNGELIVEDRVP